MGQKKVDHWLPFFGPKKQKSSKKGFSRPIYGRLPTVHRAGAAENFSSSQILPGNIGWNAHGPVNFWKTSNFDKEKKNLPEFTEHEFTAEELHCQAEPPPLPKPLFLQCFFGEGPSKTSLVGKTPASIQSLRTPFPQPCRCPRTIFSNLHPIKPVNSRNRYIPENLPGSLLNHYFYRLKRKVDHRLTRGWTRDWPAKRKNVDHRLTHKDIYIYICRRVEQRDAN